MTGPTSPKALFVRTLMPLNLFLFDDPFPHIVLDIDTIQRILRFKDAFSLATVQPFNKYFKRENKKIKRPSVKDKMERLCVQDNSRPSAVDGW